MLEGITEEYYQAVCIAEEMWEWLTDNPYCYKYQWPMYEKYKKFLTENRCSLCSYYFEKCEYGDSICKECFLGDWCLKKYGVWMDSHDYDERHKNAKAIYFAILDERLRVM